MSTETITKPIQLGDTAPDFAAKTTEGPIQFHQWIGESWCIFFSHPKDFTPVCTTELGEVAKKSVEFTKRNTKVNYPIIADESREVAHSYGMIHPKALDSFTVRSVFIIDPKKKVRLMITYPAPTGRNFDEIIRVLDALQLTDGFSVATPVNWKPGGDCIILPSIKDPEELKKKFPKGFKELKPYLRITPQPNKN